MITISLVNQSSYHHEITLIPDSSPSIPLKFRRIHDFYIISIIKVNSNQSFKTKIKWTIINCTTNNSYVIYIDKISRDFRDIYIPSNILPYGIYKFILTVTISEYPYLSKSESALLQISQSGITPNRIQLGKSIIKQKYQQDIKLHKGNHPIDLDQYTFNAISSNSKYNSPFYDLCNTQKSFLKNIKYLNYKFNSSSSFNRSDNGTIQKYNHYQSSITILAASRLSNQTQQFMDHLEYIRDATLQATGYNRIHIQQTNISIIIIGSVIWRICSKIVEYELINRRSEFGLYSRSQDNCSRIDKLRWNIYYAYPILSSSINPWILFPQINRNKNMNFFGRNPNDFPSVNQLFVSQPQINHWRSQLIDTFQHGISLNQFNFEINSFRSNDSCLIDPKTIALFNIKSSDWSNNYNFKDYALYYCLTNTNKLLIITFSLTSQIEVRLINGKVNLIVHIGDILNCVTEMNLSSIDVLSDSKHIFNLIKTNNNPFMDYIFAQNQYLIRQILTSILQEYYQTNYQNFDKTFSNTILTTTISLSSLQYQSLTQKNSEPFNKSTLVKFNKELNLPSNLRQFLAKFTTNCLVTSLSNKSLQLLQSLYSISDTIPYQDLKLSTNQFIQCANNIISVGSKTNGHQSECFSTDLTKFADGLSNEDFVKNNSIYLTVISVSTISMILIICERFHDKTDVEKLGLTSLSANDQSNKSYYEILVLNHQRKDSETKSQVHFVLYDNKVTGPVRILDDYQRKILQDGTIYAFIISVPKSLIFVNCIRICDENSVEDSSSSSCFFKYRIVHDLQPMDKFHLISQRCIEGVLPVTTQIEKVQFSSVLSKKVSDSVSDGPLWFSMFSRPSSNLFACVQTRRCCFVLLLVSILLNLMYYDLSNRAKVNNSKESLIFSFVGVCLSHDQILIGLTIGLFLLIPSLLIVQIFRRIRFRHRRISPLQKTFQKMKKSSKIKNRKDKKRKSLIRFPWWCLFVICGLCLVLIGVYIRFVIVHGFEFGDLKSCKWLRSILSGLFYSVVVSEPLKILSLSIFFVCFCLNSSNDKEYIHSNRIDLNKDEESIHSNQKLPLFIVQPVINGNCLNEGCSRCHRLKQFDMWSIIRQIFIYLCFVLVVCVIIYSNRHSNSYIQVENFRNYFLKLRQMDNVACPRNATLR